MEETTLSVNQANKDNSIAVTDMTAVPRVCDPGEPLVPGDYRYEDFTTLRQGEGVFALENDLKAVGVEGQFVHRCLCGHRGSGKSTELNSLRQWANENQFLAVITEVEEQFGPIDLEFSDLFLLAATAVEKAMQDIELPLPEQAIQPIVEWFAEVTRQHDENVKSEISVEASAQIGAKAWSLASLFAKFTAGIKAASSHAISTRMVIRNYPSTLIDLTNNLLRIANEKLATNGKAHGLLLLFDNLDRYTPAQVDRVLFTSSDLVRRLHCHAIFTIPIALEYSPLSGTSQDCYGYHVVLPMLSLRRKGDVWAEDVAHSFYKPEAIAQVRKALERRINVEQLFKNPADADLLIKMSGGCLRELLHLVTNAFSFSLRDGRFTSEAVRRGIQRVRATYIRRLSSEDYLRLARIAHHEPVPRDEHTNRLLFERWALEYLNGQDDPWIDINPLVLEIEEFRSAYNSCKTVVEK